LRGPVEIRGLWFHDPACTTRFGEPRTVPPAELDELAACLATLRLRRTRGAAPDSAILTYAPGIELEARFADDDTLVAIGYEGDDGEGPRPTLARERLDEMRIAGDRDGPLAADDAAALGTEHAWLRVCIDTHGTVTDSRALEATLAARRAGVRDGGRKLAVPAVRARRQAALGVRVRADVLSRARDRDVDPAAGCTCPTTASPG